MPIVAQQAEIFAANRARGRIALTVASAEGATRRARVVEEGSLRVRFPGPRSRDLTALLVNTAGGIAGGDRFDLDVEVGAQARLVVTGAAAEKIYRSLGPEAVIDVRLKVGTDGLLCWLPQETILFDQARLRRTIDIDLSSEATLILAEALVFGRAAMRESVRTGRVLDRWRVRIGGTLRLAETLRLDGAIADRLAEPAVAAGGAAIASMLLVPADDEKVAALEALRPRFRGEVAASAWNGLALARFVAKDGWALRHDLVAALTGLGVPLPPLWLA
jgi:urease accessory protein